MPFFEDTTLSHDITTDAGFRAWGSKIHEALEEVGMVQTADTGQINWETVTTPGSNNSDAGYEIWRFNDAAQATAPIFFRANYGRAGAAAQARMQVQAGTGSNGSGTITNPNATAGAGGGGLNPGVAGHIYACFHEGALIFIASRDITSTSTVEMPFLWIERARDLEENILVGPWAFGRSSGIGLSYYWTGTEWVSFSDDFSDQYAGGSIADASGRIVQGSSFMINPPSAPFRGLIAHRAAKITDNETGKLKAGSGEKTYKHFTGIRGTESSWGVPADYLLLHEES